MNSMLVENYLDTENLEKAPTRDGFGHALVDLATGNESVVGLCADLTESTRMHWFAEKFPERFVEVGIAEQNMMGVAAGLALEGKIPFAASYAVFSPGRNWDQVRVSVCYSELNVKIVGAHAGISVGPDGATHQALEDIAITRVLPNMTVVVPADSTEAAKATVAIGNHLGPSYIRLGRSKLPVFTAPGNHFEIGKANVLKEGNDVTIVACGSMVYQALLAAAELEGNGVSAEVINMHTIKPLDVDTLIASARKTGKVVTAEEHQITGGLGSAVAEALAENYPVMIKRVGMKDSFGQSGSPDELFEHYGMSKDGILKAVKSIHHG